MRWDASPANQFNPENILKITYGVESEAMCPKIDVTFASLAEIKTDILYGNINEFIAKGYAVRANRLNSI